MDSSPAKENLLPLPAVAGIKRPAPSLLPAFEPFSSSPSLPRPVKRQAHDSPASRAAEISKYPTPIPTSSTAILSSSPPAAAHARPGLQRTQSTLSERAPLSAVPSIALPEDGEPVLMGRSSNSSHYQLSANRLISRVHVKASYIPSSNSNTPSRVEVICMGWNGVKVHCQGRAWDLAKGDSFTSETEHDLMLDVQDARVLVSWPIMLRKGAVSVRSESPWDEENSPSKATGALQARVLGGSPLRARLGFESPVSPTPVPQEVVAPVSPASGNGAIGGGNAIAVYEDEPSSDEAVDASQAAAPAATQSTQFASQLPGSHPNASQSSELSQLEEFSDHEEENDPIIGSFGPQGDNLLPRMDALTSGDSPNVKPRPGSRRKTKLGESSRARSKSASTDEDEFSPLANHIVNQLAFSRLSSTPLSTILNHLPAELKADGPEQAENKPFSKGELTKVLETTPCIGEVMREGKDAAGKVLESEYYYIPSMDTDEKRRDAVVDGLRKPGLRACRKQHKQYYWRKPK